MGMLSGIMEKLGFDRRSRAAATPPPGSTQTGGRLQESQAPERAAPTSAQGTTSPQSSTPQPSATSAAPMSEVDVMGKLESLAAASPQKLNWRESIVDLLKLLNMDSSLSARKSLAKELGCPEEKMGDSAQMNKWLHATVLRKLAENGGNIPKELLH